MQRMVRSLGDGVDIEMGVGERGMFVGGGTGSCWLKNQNASSMSK
jgi:hypothetical protein